MTTTAPKQYVIREIFYSPQGEGNRAGTLNVFIRFAFCNLQCTPAVEGFFCDTDFGHGDRMTAEEIVAAVRAADTSRDVFNQNGCGWVILTGGEPSLQMDAPLCRALWDAGYKIAIETNGTHKVACGVDWVSVSPKPTRTCVLTYADECRIVLSAGQEPDGEQLRMSALSEFAYVSPAFRAPDVTNITGFVGGITDLPKENADWAVAYAKAHPRFRVSIQQHKVLNVR